MAQLPQEPMRIVHVIDSGGMYGAETVVLTLLAGLLDRGLQAELISTGNTGQGGDHLFEAATHRGIPASAYPLGQLTAFGRALPLLRKIRADGPALLHTHGYKATVLFGGQPRWLRRLPVVATVHGRITGKPWSRQRVYEKLERIALGRVDRVVAVSEEMVRTWHFDDLYRSRLRVIQNGISLTTPHGEELDEANAEVHGVVKGFASKGPTFLVIARLSPEKGVDAALRVFRTISVRNKHVRLVVAGDGPEGERLYKLARDYGLAERVLFAGFVENIRGLMDHFVAMLITSHTEGTPMSVLEAMAERLPVFAMAVGGIPDILAKDCGVLIRPGDEAAMGRQLLAALENPDGLAGYADRGMERAKELSSDRMVDAYISLYRELDGNLP